MADFNLTLEPSQTEFIAKPNTGFTQAYQVTNNSSNRLTFTTEVLPWSPLGEDGSITYDHVETNPHFQFSLVNADLSLGQSFTLKPGEKRQLVLKIKSDSTTPLTDSYFTFFVTQDLSQTLKSDTNSTSATARLGSHLLLSTSPIENTASKFSITQFAVSPKFIDILFPQINFTGLVHNSGNYFNKVSGKITLTKNDLVIKELNIFPANILAHSSRQISCLSDNQPVNCTVTPPFWPGIYTATITLDPSFSATPVSTTFFVFPYSLTILTLTLMTIFYILFHPRPKV